MSPRVCLTPRMVVGCNRGRTPATHPVEKLASGVGKVPQVWRESFREWSKSGFGLTVPVCVSSPPDPAVKARMI